MNYESLHLYLCSLFRQYPLLLPHHFSLSTSHLGNQALFKFVNMGIVAAGFVIHGF